MTEERLKQYIEGQRAGKSQQSPFKVPEGYFDSLCDRVMSQLPEQESQKKAKTVRLIPRLWRYSAAAVVVIGMIVGTALLVPSSKNEEKIQLANNEEETDIFYALGYDETYLNEALDYAMVDNEEIEAYLTQY